MTKSISFRDAPSFVEYYLFIERLDGTYALRTVKAEGFKRPDGKKVQVKTVPVGKAHYQIVPEYAFRIKGWLPNIRRGWFSDVWESGYAIPLRRKGILVYRQPMDPKDPVMPLDLTKGNPNRMNPTVFKTFRTQRLFEKYQRKISFQSGVAHTMLIVVAIAVLILAFLILSGMIR